MSVGGAIGRFLKWRAGVRAGQVAILRLYGPLKPWFNKTWQPGDIELVP